MTKPPRIVSFSVPAKLLDQDVISELEALGAVEFEEGWARVWVVEPEPQPSWILSSDSMPPEAEAVLVWCAQHGGLAAGHAFGVRETVDEELGWTVYRSGERIDRLPDRVVTHWRPLPNPPIPELPQ